MSNSESHERVFSTSSGDGNCIAKPTDKIPMRLRLSRVLSFSGLKSPKSPKSVSGSRVSSPNHVSPRISRYSWQPGVFDSEENRSLRSPDSGISIMSSSSKSSSTEASCKSPTTPKSPYSTTWYAVANPLWAFR